MKKLLLVTALIFISVSALAQKKIKEGVINTTQSFYINGKLIKKEFQIIYFDGLKSNIESYSSLSGHSNLIYDVEKKQMLTLLKTSIKDKKYHLNAITSSNRNSNSIKLTRGNKTKNILGFDCKEEIVKLKKNGIDLTITMFTTDKINFVVNNETIDLVNVVNGHPMYSEIVLKQDGVVSKIVTKTVMVKGQNVSKEKFSLKPPKGYTKMY